MKIKNCKRCNNNFKVKFNNSQYCEKCKRNGRLVFHCKCGNPVSYTTFHYGLKLCRKCAGKKHSKFMKTRIGKLNGFFGKKHSKKFKNNQSKQMKKHLKNPKNHPAYIDGKSKRNYPKRFNEKLKEQIRKKDNHICQNCGMTKEEHEKYYNRKLHIHHINYNTNNNRRKNLITLCFKCNIRANFNRDYWYAYFTYLMEISK